jgi:hypothetical protein
MRVRNLAKDVDGVAVAVFIDEVRASLTALCRVSCRAAWSASFWCRCHRSTKTLIFDRNIQGSNGFVR